MRGIFPVLFFTAMGLGAYALLHEKPGAVVLSGSVSPEGVGKHEWRVKRTANDQAKYVGQYRSVEGGFPGEWTFAADGNDKEQVKLLTLEAIALLGG